MCGGDYLRREAGQYLQEKNTKRSSARLKDCLVDNDLAIPLLLLMAQQRSCIVYNQIESPHLKLVGKLYDQVLTTYPVLYLVVSNHLKNLQYIILIYVAAYNKYRDMSHI